MQKIQTFLTKEIEKKLQRHSANHPFRNVLHYAVFPPGKLFRPMLVWGMASDTLKKPLTILDFENKNEKYSENLLHFIAAIEFQHAYSLAHDDLPAMDNDQMRRGKPATHAHFGEWNAILAGDALLNMTYASLAKIDHPNLSFITRVCGHCFGPKGLVLGQAMDLGKEALEGPLRVVKIHELKTSRLFQAALVGSFALMSKEPIAIYSEKWRPYWKLGRSLGIVFQLLDDLKELIDGDVPLHEKEINPWPKHYNELCLVLKSEFETLTEITLKYKLKNLQSVWLPYFTGFIKALSEAHKNNADSIAKNLGRNNFEELIAVLQNLQIRNENL